MSDVLIRDVPDDVLTALDARAAGLSLSRNEYLLLRLRQDAARPQQPVPGADPWSAQTLFSDLTDQR